MKKKTLQNSPEKLLQRIHSLAEEFYFVFFISFRSIFDCRESNL